MAFYAAKIFSATKPSLFNDVLGLLCSLTRMNLIGIFDIKSFIFNGPFSSAWYDCILPFERTIDSFLKYSIDPAILIQ